MRFASHRNGRKQRRNPVFVLSRMVDVPSSLWSVFPKDSIVVLPSARLSEIAAQSRRTTFAGNRRGPLRTAGPYGTVGDQNGVLDLNDLDQRSALEYVLDRLGTLSARAQKLPAPITSLVKLLHTDHSLYLFYDSETHKALGLLKTGRKTLFIRNAVNTVLEIKPLCVLDYYVHEDYQRIGIGRRLFDRMCEFQSVSDAATLAYDRPSPKLLSFLQKHFGLSRFTPQNNNFVVFDKYFDVCSASSMGSGTAGGASALRGDATSLRTAERGDRSAAPSGASADVARSLPGVVSLSRLRELQNPRPADATTAAAAVWRPGYAPPTVLSRGPTSAIGSAASGVGSKPSAVTTDLGPVPRTRLIHHGQATSTRPF